jgi:hypothetical protein
MRQTAAIDSRKCVEQILLRMKVAGVFELLRSETLQCAPGSGLTFGNPANSGKQRTSRTSVGFATPAHAECAVYRLSFKEFGAPVFKSDSVKEERKISVARKQIIALSNTGQENGSPRQQGI